MSGDLRPGSEVAKPVVSLCACLVVVAGMAALSCGPRVDAPQASARAAGERDEGPVARLATFAFDHEGSDVFAGHSYEATCRLRLERGLEAAPSTKAGRAGKEKEPSEGDFSSGLLGALEEHVRYRLADEGGDFHVLVEQRFDDRFIRQGSDSMEAAQIAGRLAVRRQREDFTHVPNLHGEAARYREIGRGVLGSLLAGFDPAFRREGDRVLLGPGRQGTDMNESAPLPSRPNDDRWEPHFRYYARAAVQGGFLLWPEGASMPSAGELVVEATLNGYAFHADCAFVIERRPGREGFPELPEVLPSLERPRVQNDINRVIRAIQAPPE